MEASNRCECFEIEEDSLNEHFSRLLNAVEASNRSECFEIEADGPNEHFSRPSNAESVNQDEDELIWAVIEWLPSQKRSNYAIIERSPSVGNGAPMKEAVDVRKLDQTGRELLLMKAMG